MHLSCFDFQFVLAIQNLNDVIHVGLKMHAFFLYQHICMVFFLPFKDINAMKQEFYF